MEHSPHRPYIRGIQEIHWLYRDLLARRFLHQNFSLPNVLPHLWSQPPHTYAPVPWYRLHCNFLRGVDYRILRTVYSPSGRQVWMAVTGSEEAVY